MIKASDVEFDMEQLVVEGIEEQSDLILKKNNTLSVPVARNDA